MHVLMATSSMAESSVPEYQKLKENDVPATKFEHGTVKLTVDHTRSSIVLGVTVAPLSGSIVALVAALFGKVTDMYRMPLIRNWVEQPVPP
jgi:hypothetical protein